MRGARAREPVQSGEASPGMDRSVESLTGVLSERGHPARSAFADPWNIGCDRVTDGFLRPERPRAAARLLTLTLPMTRPSPLPPPPRGERVVPQSRGRVRGPLSGSRAQCAHKVRGVLSSVEEEREPGFSPIEL